MCARVLVLVHVCVCVYVCVRVCVYLCLSLPFSLCVCMCVCMYVCVCARAFVCVFVFMRACGVRVHAFQCTLGCEPGEAIVCAIHHKTPVSLCETKLIRGVYVCA